MTIQSGPDQSIIYSFDYPIYQIKAVGANILLAAGGGGLSKTGVPNRIDAVQLNRPVFGPKTTKYPIERLIPKHTNLIGGTNTQQDAIMHMTLTSQSSGAATVLALEGSTCREYFLYANDLEPSQVADVSDHDFAVTSTGPRYFNSPASSSSSSTDESNGISTTVKKRSKSGIDGTVTTGNHSVADSSGREQLPWSFQTLRSVVVTPNTTLVNRRRMESCSSTGSASATTDSALLDDELACISSGGPSGTWCAVGTKHGGVAILDRYSMLPSTTPVSTRAISMGGHPAPNAPYSFDQDVEFEDSIFPLQPFCVLSDVSGGRCAPVCDVSLSSVTTFASNQSEHLCEGEGGGTATTSRLTPLLATISGKPMGSLLSIWRLPEPCRPISTSEPTGKVTFKAKTPAEKEEVEQSFVGEAVVLHAEHRMTNSPIPVDRKAASARCGRPENGNRFRHCEFLHLIHQIHAPSPSPFDSGIFLFLSATEQPVSPTTRSVCHLSVWLVPQPTAASTTASLKPTPPVLGLERFATVALPPGEIPACIAVHPSRIRGLIALGTMEGSVNVYFVSIRNRSLQLVYSMPKAHPIFVTSLTFLPPRQKLPQEEQQSALKGVAALLPAHYEVVSASADRIIRWHPGPSVQRIAALGVGLDSRKWFGILSPSGLAIFLLLLMLPLLWAPLNEILRVHNSA